MYAAAYSLAHLLAHYVSYGAAPAADQEPALIEGKLVNHSLLLKHLVR